MGGALFDNATPQAADTSDRSAALERFETIRRDSEGLAANLTAEDQSIQSMPDVSPTKWGAATFPNLTARRKIFYPKNIRLCRHH